MAGAEDAGVDGHGPFVQLNRPVKMAHGPVRSCRVGAGVQRVGMVRTLYPQPPHDDSTPTAEPTTREQWIAYHVAREPKITHPWS
jgi:hypothetical protein